MKNEMHRDLIEALIRDYEFKERKGWLRNGRCPACNKKELYAHYDNPYLLICPRENKCQGGNPWRGNIKELYPEFFEKFNDRYKSTDKNPNATADAYMQLARGFNLSKIKGSYEQGQYWNQNANKGTATVRFLLDKSKNLYMERFVETIYITDEHGDVEPRKQHFSGSYHGLAWISPTIKLMENDRVFIVEACIDALSLISHGHKAIATLSSTNYPQKFLESAPKNIEWVWALDNDKAGTKYTRTYFDRMIEQGFSVSVAIPPNDSSTVKRDWNDLHKSKKINDSFLSQCFFEGRLLTAKNAEQKALTIWMEKEKSEFHFDFNNCWYWFRIDINKLENLGIEEDESLTQEERKEKIAKNAGMVILLSLCKITFLYYQCNAVTDDAWYYARIEFPHGGKPVKSTFTGSQLNAVSKFKERLTHIAPGSIYKGSGKQLEAIVEKKIFDITRVDTVDFIGFSKEHDCYIFNDHAIAKGKIYHVNEEDYFDIGKLKVKSIDHSVKLNLSKKSKYNDKWIDLLWQCYGEKGIAALVGWFGSLFAEQIRSTQGSYPFLEIVGQAGAGKSTLLIFLWKLFGRAGQEGFDPQTSSIPSRSRIMNQVSNIPIVLLEGDRSDDSAHARRFSWDELKKLYDGQAYRSRAMKTQGNETYEPPFRASIVISQNSPVDSSEAILSRIVHLFFTRSGHSLETKKAAEELATMEIAELSYFLTHCCINEKQVLSNLKNKVREYENYLLQECGIKAMRVVKNHAQMMALTDSLADLINLPEEIRDRTKSFFSTIAAERESILGKDHPIVADFWEKFIFLDQQDRADFGQSLDHSAKPTIIAINLNDFERSARRNGQSITQLSELRKYLPQSKSRKYQATKAIHSAVKSKTVKCWLFELPPGESKELSPESY